jgi:hypothetical protein
VKHNALSGWRLKTRSVSCFYSAIWSWLSTMWVARCPEALGLLGATHLRGLRSTSG